MYRSVSINSTSFSSLVSTLKKDEHLISLLVVSMSLLKKYCFDENSEFEILLGNNKYHINIDLIQTETIRNTLNSTVKLLEGKIAFSSFSNESKGNYITISKNRSDINSEGLVYFGNNVDIFLKEKLHSDAGSSIERFFGLISCSLDMTAEKFFSTVSSEFNYEPAVTAHREENVLNKIFLHKDSEIAVDDGTTIWTYGELYSFVDSAYREIEASDKEVVIIYADRSIKFISAMLASLAAGKKYIPFEKSYSVNRLLQSGLPINECLIISDDNYFPGCNYIDIDFPKANSGICSNLCVGFSDIAGYGILTSGTTGSGKLIDISVNSLNTSTAARIEYYQDVGEFLILSPFHFDSSVAGLYMTLSLGGTIILPSTENIINFHDISDLIEPYSNITSLGIPKIQNLIINSSNFNKFERIIYAGEKITKTDLEFVTRYRHAVNFFNEYGPTENTVWSTVKDYGSINELRIESIGYSNSYTSCIISTPKYYNQLFGLTGELTLISPCLSSAETNGVVRIEGYNYPSYATGDLVYVTGNELNIVGRKDNEVKISGVRINLDAINSDIQNMWFLQSEIVYFDDRLFIFIENEKSIHKHEVVNFASKHGLEISDDNVIEISEFTRNQNGKKDINRLKDYLKEYKSFKNDDNSYHDEYFSIFSDILKCEVAPHDNFFELGGNSLKAALICSKIGALCDRKLYPKVLFDNPIILNFLDKAVNSSNNVSRPVLGIDELEEYFDFSENYSGDVFEFPIVFILGCQRSGTTLLKNLISVNTSLVVPDDLELGGFGNLGVRSKWINNGHKLYDAGTQKAIDDLGIMQEIVESNDTLSISGIYSKISRGKTIVDKSPLYSYSSNNLKLLKRRFPLAKYIWIQRNPKSVVSSMEDANIFQTFNFTDKVDVIKSAENLWLLSNRNIFEFVNEVEYIKIRYEDLVKNPELCVNEIQVFLNLEVTNSFVSPYEGSYFKNVNIGDYKFSKFSSINTDQITSYLDKNKSIRLRPELLHFAESLEAYPLTDIEFPVSKAVRDMWIAIQRKSMNVPIAFKGCEATVENFVNHLGLLLKTHSSLRTIYYLSSENNLVSKILPMSEVKKLVDVRDLCEKDISDFHFTKFDHRVELPLRVGFLKKQNIFLIVLSHICIDNVSVEIIRSALTTLLRGGKLGLIDFHLYESRQESKSKNSSPVAFLDSRKALLKIGKGERCSFEREISTIDINSKKNRFSYFLASCINTLNEVGLQNYNLFVPVNLRKGDAELQVVGLCTNYCGIPILDKKITLEKARELFLQYQENSIIGPSTYLAMQKKGGCTNDRFPLITFSYVETSKFHTVTNDIPNSINKINNATGLDIYIEYSAATTKIRLEAAISSRVTLSKITDNFERYVNELR